MLPGIDPRLPYLFYDLNTGTLTYVHRQKKILVI